MPILSYLFLFARKRCLFKRMLFLYCCRNHSIDDVKQSHPWRKLHFSLFRQSSTMKSLQGKGQTNPRQKWSDSESFLPGTKKIKILCSFPLRRVFLEWAVRYLKRGRPRNSLLNDGNQATSTRYTSQVYLSHPESIRTCGKRAPFRQP